MKITCQACAAKYTIADEKVVGKTVKIRCKKCGANIIVNAGDAGGTATGPATADVPQRFDDGGQAPAQDVWTVNVADGDQRTMSLAEVVSGYRGGIVTGETFCWKDGMGDWLPVHEIPDLYAACTGATPAAAAREEEDAATRVHEAPTSSQTPVSASPAANGAGALAAAAPAARRTAARAPTADLFGNVAQAGGEDDVLTSAPAGAPERHEDAKLIGERNENSVLFSLGALGAPTARGAAPADYKGAATEEASGLIDIRQLSAQLTASDDQKKKQSRVDDIMNLGGGSFSAALSAPVLSAPPIEEFAVSPGAAAAPPAGKSKVIFAALGVGALVVAGAVGAAFMATHPSTGDKAGTAASATTEGEPSASAAAASAASVASAAPPPEPSVPPAAAAAPPGTAAPTKAPAVAEPTEKHAAAAKEPAVEKAAPAPAPATEAVGPFDMGAARARLAAIAGAVEACKRGDVSGTWHVIVTFATSGAAQSATVSGAPFEGTPTGACVASKFRGARVPAFSGAPFTVSKSFSIL